MPSQQARDSMNFRTRVPRGSVIIALPGGGGVSVRLLELLLPVQLLEVQSSAPPPAPQALSNSVALVGNRQVPGVEVCPSSRSTPEAEAGGAHLQGPQDSITTNHLPSQTGWC